MGLEKLTVLEFKLSYHIDFLGKLLKKVAKLYGMSTEEAKKLYEDMIEKSMKNHRYYLNQDYFDVYLASSYRKHDQLERVLKVEERLEKTYRVISPLHVRLNPVKLGLFEEEMLRKRSRAFFGILFAETSGLLHESRISIELGKPTVLWISERKKFIKGKHPTFYSSQKTSPHFSTDIEIALGCLEDALKGKVKTYQERKNGITIKKCKRCNSNLRVVGKIV